MSRPSSWLCTENTRFVIGEEPENLKDWTQPRDLVATMVKPQRLKENNMAHWYSSCTNMSNCLITQQINDLFHYRLIGLSYELPTVHSLLDKFGQEVDWLNISVISQNHLFCEFWQDPWPYFLSLNYEFNDPETTFCLTWSLLWRWFIVLIWFSMDSWAMLSNWG